MKTKKYLFLLIFWTVSSQAILVEEPEACFRAQGVCALKAVGGSFLVERDQAKLHLSEGSILIRKKSHEYVLVQGSLYVESLNELTAFSTEYIQAKSKKGGFWVLKNAQNQTVIRNIQSSDLVLTNRKDQKLAQLIAGFENWYAGFDSLGHQLTGILKPIEFVSYMKEHLKIDSVDPARAVQDLKKIKLNWDQSQSNVSQIYEQVVNRKPSSVEVIEESEKNVLPASESEAKKLKQLYREKNFIDPELVEAHQ